MPSRVASTPSSWDFRSRSNAMSFTACPAARPAPVSRASHRHCPGTRRCALPSPAETLETFVSPYVGVVEAVVEFVRTPDECRLVTYGATLADGMPTIGQPLTGTAGGAHPDR